MYWKYEYAMFINRKGGIVMRSDVFLGLYS